MLRKPSMTAATYKLESYTNTASELLSMAKIKLFITHGTTLSLTAHDYPFQAIDQRLMDDIGHSSGEVPATLFAARPFSP